MPLYPRFECQFLTDLDNDDRVCTVVVVAVLNYLVVGLPVCLQRSIFLIIEYFCRKYSLLMICPTYASRCFVIIDKNGIIALISYKIDLFVLRAVCYCIENLLIISFHLSCFNEVLIDPTYVIWW